MSNQINSLSFDILRKYNVLRCEEIFHKIDEWNPTDWACAMAGEMGETCNAVKKFKRGDGDIRAIADELADTIIYADLLAARLNIDLSDAVRQKFNETSIRRGSSFKLP